MQKKGFFNRRNTVLQKNAGISELAKEKYRLQNIGFTLPWDEKDLDSQEAAENGVQDKQGKQKT